MKENIHNLCITIFSDRKLVPMCFPRGPMVKKSPVKCRGVVQPQVRRLCKSQRQNAPTTTKPAHLESAHNMSQFTTALISHCWWSEGLLLLEFEKGFLQTKTGTTEKKKKTNLSTLKIYVYIQRERAYPKQQQ